MDFLNPSKSSNLLIKVIYQAAKCCTFCSWPAQIAPRRRSKLCNNDTGWKITACKQNETAERAVHTSTAKFDFCTHFAPPMSHLVDLGLDYLMNNIFWDSKTISEYLLSNMVSSYPFLFQHPSILVQYIPVKYIYKRLNYRSVQSEARNVTSHLCLRAQRGVKRCFGRPLVRTSWITRSSQGKDLHTNLLLLQVFYHSGTYYHGVSCK